jgi:hypothetical protein
MRGAHFVDLIILSYPRDVIYRLLGNGDKLQIDSAHLSDAGSYTCQMSNVAGQANITYQLDVFSRIDIVSLTSIGMSVVAPPTIDRSNLVEIYQVKSAQTARLECPMHGKPTPRIMWLMNGRELQMNDSESFEDNDF